MAEAATSRQGRGGARRGFLVAGTLALALAACAAPGTRGRPDRAAPPTAQKPIAAAEDQRHRVALLVPTTGKNAALGQSIANAANLALLDSGNQQIRLTVYNTATGAAGAAQRAVTEGNRLFLGPLLATDVNAVKPVARSAQVPVLAFSNDQSLGGGGAWILGYQPSQAIARVVAYAKSRGVDRLGAMIPSGTYGQRVSSALLDAARDNDARVTTMVTFNRDAASLGSAIRKLGGGGAPAPAAAVRPDGTVARAKPAVAAPPFEALLIADSGRTVVASAPLLARAGLGNVRLLGPELWSVESGLSQVPRLHGAWFAAVPDDNFRQLVGHYRKRFGGAPYRLASLGYDSVLLINRIGGRWALGKPFPIDALTDRGGFAGIDGAFRFHPNGEVERAMEVQQIGADGFTTVSPAPRGFGR
jgi:ABC-type branched-subunit amino acid transport system substrate-binding protein